MFQVNDYVVYGSNGVCKVLEIGTPDMHGIDSSKLYYKLKPISLHGNIIYTPIANKNNLLRSIITKEEALELIDEIPNIEIIDEPNDKLRESKYKESMRKYNCREWVKIIKTSYLQKEKRLSAGKKAGNIELRYLSEAEDFLYNELSIPLGISKEETVDFITNRLQALSAI